MSSREEERSAMESPGKRRRKEVRRSHSGLYTGRLSVVGWMAVIAAFLAFFVPFIPLVVASFSFRWHWPAVFPSEWLWDARGTTPFPIGWDYLFSPISGMGTAFLNTVAIAGATSAIAVVISLPAARALARYRFPGKSAVEFFLLTPVIVPQIAVGIGMLLLFIRLGLAGTYIGIILAHLIPSMPYAVRILTSVFQNLSSDYEDQARTLGATRMRTLRYVVLPMVMPGVMTAALFAFLISANIFLLTFLISRGRLQTLPTMLFSHIEGAAPLDPTTAGLVLVVSVPGVVFLMVSDWITGDPSLLGKGFGGGRR